MSLQRPALNSASSYNDIGTPSGQQLAQTCRSHALTGHSHTPPGHTHTPPGHTHTPPGHTHSSSSHTYSYPVLASDPASFAKAQLDPRVCSLDSDTVLLWKDIDITDHKRGATCRECLQGASIEQVMEEFVDVARNHKLNSELRRCGSRGYIIEPNNLMTLTHNRHQMSRDVLDAPSQRVHVSQTGTTTRSRKPEIWCTQDVQDKQSSPELSSTCQARQTIPVISEQCNHDYLYKRSFGSTESSRSKVCRDGHRTSCGSFSDDLDSTDDEPDVFDDLSTSQTVTMVNNKHHYSFINDIRKSKVHCHNPECMKPFEVSENSYKNCQFCHVVYCCWYCRKRDRKRHEGVACHGCRVNKACKEVIQFCGVNKDVLQFISRMARRGYMSWGRGCILMGFPDLSATREFTARGLDALEIKPLYLTIKEMEVSQLHGRVLGQLMDACSRYDPVVDFVLNVGVGTRWNRCNTLVHDHVTLEAHQQSSERNVSLMRSRSGSVGSDGGYGSLNCSINHTTDLECQTDIEYQTDMEWQVGDIVYYDYSLVRHRPPIVQWCAKLQLSKMNFFMNNKNLGDSHANSRYGPTLIISGIPGLPEVGDGRRSREINFMNIQRKLRERGVALRHQFPRVYTALVKYVTGGDHFPAEIIYPVDTVHKQLFMCVLMPESEPELEWTQSANLLDDLDISKQCLWKAVPFPGSFPSPNRLCWDSDVSPTLVKHTNIPSQYSHDIPSNLNKVESFTDKNISRPVIVTSQPVTAKMKTVAPMSQSAIEQRLTVTSLTATLSTRKVESTTTTAAEASKPTLSSNDSIKFDARQHQQKPTQQPYNNEIHRMKGGTNSVVRKTTTNIHQNKWRKQKHSLVQGKGRQETNTDCESPQSSGSFSKSSHQPSDSMSGLSPQTKRLTWQSARQNVNKILLDWGTPSQA